MYLSQGSQTVNWTSLIISTSIIGVDYCGSVTESLIDVTTGVELTLDASIFTITKVGATSMLTIATSDNTDEGIYVLRLTAWYDNY